MNYIFEIYRQHDKKWKFNQLLRGKFPIVILIPLNSGKFGITFIAWLTIIKDSFKKNPYIQGVHCDSIESIS